jgi:hypothetical protein
MSCTEIVMFDREGKACEKKEVKNACLAAGFFCFGMFNFGLLKGVNCSTL